MSKKTSKIELKFRPKLSPKALLTDNWMVIKLLFKTCPLGMSLYAFEAFRNEFLIFFEHTWLIKYVLECVQYHRPFKDAAIAVAAIFLIITITSITGNIVWQRLQPKTELKCRAALKNKIFDKAREVDLEQFDNPEYYNDFVMNVDKTDDIISRTLWLVQTTCQTIAGLLTTGVFFAAENIYVFLCVMAASIIHLFLILRRNNYYFSKWKNATPYYRKGDYTKRLFYLNDYAKELRLNPDLKEHALKTYDEAFDGLVDVLKFHDKKIIKLGILASSLQTLLLDIGTVLLLTYQAGVLHLISYAMVIVMMNSMYRLRRQFVVIIQRIAQSAETCLYIEKIHEFLKSEPKIKSERNLPVENKSCEIELDNVSFRYNDKDGDVLKNISLKVGKKEKIALVGYNGAGKTTLIKLIMRLYDTSGGKITMDGVDIKDYDVEQYRHNIGVIFQDFNIYAASLKENVVMGLTDSSMDDRVNDTLVSSGFSSRLERMKDGLETQLTKEFDDNGVNLSGGENQKIAIARSFFKNASLIILDEPSSALDPIAEYNFNKYLLKAAKDCTVIFISHRLSTTRIADKIYMLENGEIVESGTHDELLEKCGKYYDMWHAQADKYTI